MKTTSIAGSPAASTASPPLRVRRCDTQVRLLTFRDSPIVYLWRLFLLRGIWIRLAAVRRGAWLVTIHEWAMDLGSFFWLDLGQLPAVGLGSLSLWRMALRYLLWWLVLFSAGLLRIPGVPCPSERAVPQ